MIKSKPDCEKKLPKSPCCKKARTLFIGGIMVVTLFFLFRWMGL